MQETVNQCLTLFEHNVTGASGIFQVGSYGTEDRSTDATHVERVVLYDDKWMPKGRTGAEAGVQINPENVSLIDYHSSKISLNLFLMPS